MREAPLGELLEAVIDHRGKTPRKLGGDFVRTGVPVVSAIHLKGGRIRWEERSRFVSMDMYKRWMPVPLETGDVLLTSEAPLGEIAQVPNDSPLVLSQRLFALRARKDALDSTYLRYFLESDLGQHRLLVRATGTTVVGIRQSELLKVLIPLPPLGEQRRIAGVLSALDALIETNRHLIQKLVYCADLVALSMVGDEACERRTFGDVADVFGGGTPKTREPSFWEGDVAWATPTDLTALPSPYLFDTKRTLTKAGLKACSSELHPVGSILMTSRATIGAFALPQTPVAVNQGFIVVRPRAEKDLYFLFHEMRRRVRDFVAQANGSTFLELSRGNFKRMPVNWPEDDLRGAMSDRLKPLHVAAASLQTEIQQVTSVRDELLPLLMSGAISADEVRV